MGSQEPTETSPLLIKPTSSNTSSSDSIHDDSNTVSHENNGRGILSNGALKLREDEESQEPENREQQYQGMPEVRAKLKYIIPAISIGIFLSALDQTIIISCYGKIGSDLKALNNSSWISTAYFLTLTSFQPLYGKLSDIFGRKPCLLFAYAVFGTGCLFCGLARNMNELIAARAVAGIGGGGMTAVVSILMSDIVPLRERGTWQGIINMIYASGAGCGTPLGGFFADYVTWRWAFLAQAPICALAFASVAFTLNLPRKEASDWKTKFRRVDFVGALVLIAAVFTLLLGLDHGSNVSWANPLTIVSLCFSAPLFLAFLLVELKLATEPFAPARIIFERSLVACYLCNFFALAAWMSIVFYLALYYQAVDKFTASQAGLAILPPILVGVCGSLVGGLVMQKTGKYYWLTVCAYAVTALAMIPVLLCSGLVVNSIYGITAGLVFSGFANGMGITTTLIGLIANAAPEDQAITTACSYLFRSLGSVVGLSISATVVQQSLRMQLRDRLQSGKDAETIVKRVRESLEYVQTLSPEVQAVVRECYAKSIRNGLFFMAAITLCAAGSSWFIREKKLSK